MNLRLFGVLFALVIGGFVALGIGLGLTLTTTGALASHDDPNTIHACVYESSGYTQIMAPGVAPNCRSSQFEVSWPDAASFGDLEARVDALEAENAAQATQINDLETENTTQATQISDLETTVDSQGSAIGDLQTVVTTLVGQVPECLSVENGDAVFSGCNVYVNNGLGSTATKNETGNLIVGYNEESVGGEDRSGSHNLVVGQQHSYSSHGGFVAGFNNTVSGSYSSVSGGVSNEASGSESSVSGGVFNIASGSASSVSGGVENIASGQWSTVSGGLSNEAIGSRSSVSGGFDNVARGSFSSVSGGFENQARGAYSSVSGGESNDAIGVNSSISGGFDRAATGIHDWVAGNSFEDF